MRQIRLKHALCFSLYINVYGLYYMTLIYKMKFSLDKERHDILFCKIQRKVYVEK